MADSPNTTVEMSAIDRPRTAETPSVIASGESTAIGEPRQVSETDSDEQTPQMDDNTPPLQIADATTGQPVVDANRDEAVEPPNAGRKDAEIAPAENGQPSGEEDRRWMTGNIKEKLLDIGIGMFVYSIIIPIMWLSDVNSETTEQEPASQQRAAEEGVSNPPQSTPAQDGQPTAPTGLLGHVRPQWSKVIRFIVRLISKSIWRLALAAGGFYVFSLVYYFDMVTKRYPLRVLMVAFGFLNFTTAAASYLVFFDAEGTHAPGWANIFGR
jgi:hypothetical protein